MIKITLVNTFLFLVNFSICQKRISSIDITDSSIMIGNVAAYRMNQGGIVSVNQIKKAASREKVKEYRDKDLNSWLYFFCNSGIEIDCGEKSYEVLAIHILFHKLRMYPNFWIGRKMQKYSGKLTIRGVEINSETTFGFLKTQPVISCCSEVKSNEIKFNVGNLNCSVLFEDVMDSSKIINIVLY